MPTQKRVRFADVQPPSLPVVPVKSSGFFHGLTAKVKSASHLCHAFFDSGAAVNLIKSPTFKSISEKSRSEIPRASPDLCVSGISGNIVTPHSKVFLKLSLSSLEPDICDYFYVVDDESFSADILIGFHSMSKHNISLFLFTHQIAQNGTLIHASLPPGSHIPPLVSIATPTLRADAPPFTPVLVESPSGSSVSPSSSSGSADSPRAMLSSDTRVPSPPPPFLTPPHALVLGQLC